MQDISDFCSITKPKNTGWWLMDDIANYVIYLAVYSCHLTVYQLHTFQIQGDYLAISNTQEIFTLSTNVKV